MRLGIYIRTHYLNLNINTSLNKKGDCTFCNGKFPCTLSTHKMKKKYKPSSV